MKQANFLYTSELENMTSTCFKALEGSNYDVRVCIAQLIGSLMAMTQTPLTPATGKGRKTVSPCSLEEVFASMSGGFLRGGTGFLKGGGGELLKSTAPREVRVGVTQVSKVLRIFFFFKIASFLSMVATVHNMTTNAIFVTKLPGICGLFYRNGWSLGTKKYKPDSQACA